MKPLRVAIVGLGAVAHNEHLPAIADSTDWELAAAVSRDGRLDGVDCFADLESLLAARADIDVVSLALPPVPRYACAVAAIAVGLHVMLEKPPGATLAECHALEALARAAGVSIFATWHSREAQQVEAARAWLAGQRLRRLRITWREDVRRWHPGQTWLWQPGGLGVFDPGINALSIVTAILEDPLRVTSARLCFPENCATPIAAAMTLAHPHGAEVGAEFDFREQGEQVWSIEAETGAGVMLLSAGGARLAIDGVERPTGAAIDRPLGDEYARLYARMAELVRARESEMDLAPMTLVADAFLLGRRETVEAFVE